MAFDRWPTHKCNRALRRACLVTKRQECFRATAPSRRAQGRERIPCASSFVCTSHLAVRSVVGFLHFGKVSSSAELWSSLPSMCIEAQESTANSRSAGFFEDGAGFTQTSEGEKNVALSFVLSFSADASLLLQCFLLCPLEVRTFSRIPCDGPFLSRIFTVCNVPFFSLIPIFCSSLKLSWVSAAQNPGIRNPIVLTTLTKQLILSHHFSSTFYLAAHQPLRV